MALVIFDISQFQLLVSALTNAVQYKTQINTRETREKGKKEKDKDFLIIELKCFFETII